MKKEILGFIKENNLSPFNKARSTVKSTEDSIFKTRDAKSVYGRVLGQIATNFAFSDTYNLFHFFKFSSDIEKIKRRQEFFINISGNIEKSFLNNLDRPKKSWRPNYGVLVVTEDDDAYNELQKMGCPVKLLISDQDVSALEDYDLIQAIDCEQYKFALERLPQTIFLKSLDEAYLERYLEELSGWVHILSVIKGKIGDEELTEIMNSLEPLVDLIDKKKEIKLTKEGIEEKTEEINKKIAEEIKKMTLSGDQLFNMLSKNELPEELKKIVRNLIVDSELPENLFRFKVPVELDEDEVDKLLRKQGAESNSTFAEVVRKRAEEIRKIPDKLKRISDLILLFDFMSGVANFSYGKKFNIEESGELFIEKSTNLFLDNAQPISFSLNEENRCSILTGANSGGKTTLLEHIIQIISLFQIGLPVEGIVKMPLFSEIYYFAKNKGSANKGAFETLLSQMSKINPGKKTLILADEIESVTEPGVAGAIVSASAQYFLEKGCFMVIATHLGKEIQKILPKNARVDGIEAKGLDENFDLIVDHNPVLGRLANSTPELIVEKMANSQKAEYFVFLSDYLKRSK